LVFLSTLNYDGQPHIRFKNRYLQCDTGWYKVQGSNEVNTSANSIHGIYFFIRHSQYR